MTRDVESQPPDDNHNDTTTNHSPEEEYRQRCRTFFRQSTSVIEDDDDDNDNDNHDEEPPVKDNRVVLEAVDCLIQQQQQQHHDASVEDAYAIFWSSLSAEQRAVLVQCGLPTTTSSTSSTTTSTSAESLSLERLVTIRTEERKMAHQVTMQQRLQVLQTLWNELVTQQQQQQQQQQPQQGTTRHQVLLIQQTLRQFVHDYHSSSIACHSLLAGMRHSLERQLDQTQPSCVVWTLDAAVITEAMVAKPQGGSSRYLRHALQALLSFLVGLPTTNFIINNNNNNNNDDDNKELLQLAVNPSWSDRTLTHILQVLPLPHELHARPTGTFQVPLPNDDDTTTRPNKKSATMVLRTNVEGDSDEPMDVCLALVKNLKRRGWWFC